MNRVRLLDEEVIKKIAAGEVVERPASVVKELVENAIDAGSDEIRIELNEGGKSLILIKDNGGGIAPGDIEVALKRHATSKISSAEDLFAIHSLGFRGEALAAISAVSKFSLSSRQKAAAEGKKVHVEGGTSQAVPWSGAEGTTVVVKDLFYNVPVRAKFLKSAETEYAHCLELVQALALAYPQVSFFFSHNGKEKFSAPKLAALPGEKWRGEDLLRERWALIVAEDGDRFLYTKEENEFARWEALLSPVGWDRATSKYLFHYVNGRWVKDKVLSFGVLRGYHSHLLKGRYPQVFSFLDCDPSLIDVNVHPTKTELRFQYPAEVQGLMSFAIRRALRDISLSEVVPREGKREGEGTAPSQREVWNRRFHAGSFGGSDGSLAPPAPPLSPIRGEASRFPSPVRGEASRFPSLLEEKPAPNTALLEDASYLGTFQKCYLLFEVERESKLLVIDQHAFHERILYEKLCADPILLKQSQPLIIPETVMVDAKQGEAIREKENVFKEAGFNLTFVGDDTIEVRAVPSLLIGKLSDQLILELANKIADGSLASFQQVFHNVLATIACHAAVRAGEVLEPHDLKILLKDAASVDFYHNCPHGRRVLKWWTKSEVAGWFDR